jgi:hypothetical protein
MPSSLEAQTLQLTESLAPVSFGDANSSGAGRETSLDDILSDLEQFSAALSVPVSTPSTSIPQSRPHQERPTRQRHTPIIRPVRVAVSGQFVLPLRCTPNSPDTLLYSGPNPDILSCGGFGVCGPDLRLVKGQDRRNYKGPSARNISRQSLYAGPAHLAMGPNPDYYKGPTIHTTHAVSSNV